MEMTATKKGTKNNPIIISPEELQEKIAAAENGDRPMEIEVTKAKYFNERLNIGYNRSFIKDDETTGDPIEVLKAGKENGTNMVHPDMKIAMSLLKSHLLILCDQVEAIGKSPDDLDKDMELMARVSVTEFKLEGIGNNYGVSIIGNILNKRGKRKLLVTPFEKFVDVDSPYDYKDELEMVVQHCQNEAKAYYMGKIAPSAPTLFDSLDITGELNDHERPN